jgi:hypothetical protein
MSKVDALRAMREARYAENTARAKTAPPPMSAKAPTAAKPAAAKRAAISIEVSETAEPALCGHRNMGGRSCTRELGHGEKSHRYS